MPKKNKESCTDFHKLPHPTVYTGIYARAFSDKYITPGVYMRGLKITHVLYVTRALLLLPVLINTGKQYTRV